VGAIWLVDGCVVRLVVGSAAVVNPVPWR